MQNIGKIVQIIGAVVDIRFSKENLPKLLNSIEINNNGTKLVVEVAQHIGDDVVRCIAMSSTDGLVRGMDAVDTGAPIKVPVGKETLGRVFNLLGEPIDEKPMPPVEENWAIHREAPSYEEQTAASEVLETGIKVIDLIAPYLKGGKIGLFVDSEELLGGLFFLTDDKAASAITGVVLPIDCGFAAYSGV